MHSLSWVRLPPPSSPAHIRPQADTQSGIRRCDSLALGELEALARPGAAGLLALDDARIAGQEPLLPQLRAMPLVREAQRPRDRQPQRPGLPRHPTAATDGPHVAGPERVGRGTRLLDVRPERRPRKIVAERATVDVPLPRAWREIHARAPDLAAPDGVPAELRRRDAAHRAAAAGSGWGRCAAWGWSAPPYTLSICFTFWRDRVVLGNMPQTARSITRSGCVANTSFTARNRSCPM